MILPLRILRVVRVWTLSNVLILLNHAQMPVDTRGAMS
jgi:hypothetical protein